jgi:hypothetical protein
MGDRTGLCEATPEAECNEAGRIEECNYRSGSGELCEWRVDPAVTRRPHESGYLGGGRGVARAGITTAVGGQAPIVD